MRRGGGGNLDFMRTNNVKLRDQFQSTKNTFSFLLHFFREIMRGVVMKMIMMLEFVIIIWECKREARGGRFEGMSSYLLFFLRGINKKGTVSNFEET